MSGLRCQGRCQFGTEGQTEQQRAEHHPGSCQPQQILSPMITKALPRRDEVEQSSLREGTLACEHNRSPAATRREEPPPPPCGKEGPRGPALGTATPYSLHCL